MEQQTGFLYVLANSAMPGLVKVGKTTRSPSERAGELSGVSGLPTPFIVVYEQLFEDCGAAESFVHVYLDQKGYRVADNREFFNAPVNVVVKAISLAPGALDDTLPVAAAPAETDDLLLTREPDELDAMTLPATSQPAGYPWESVFAEAQAHYYGLDDYIRDYTEAIKLFRRAAQLGALPAYGCIGTMYERGEGVREDKQRALEFFKEGARKGSIYCYWAMGYLFVCQNNPDNAEKCFSLFLKGMHSGLPDGQHLTELELDRIYTTCVFMLDLKELPSVLNSFVAERLPIIRDKATNILEANVLPTGNQQRAARIRAVIEYLDGICSTNRDLAPS